MVNLTYWTCLMEENRIFSCIIICLTTCQEHYLLLWTAVNFSSAIEKSAQRVSVLLKTKTWRNSAQREPKTFVNLFTNEVIWVWAIDHIVIFTLYKSYWKSIWFLVFAWKLAKYSASFCWQLRKTSDLTLHLKGEGRFFQSKAIESQSSKLDLDCNNVKP